MWGESREDSSVVVSWGLSSLWLGLYHSSLDPRHHQSCLRGISRGPLWTLAGRGLTWDSPWEWWGGQGLWLWAGVPAVVCRRPGLWRPSLPAAAFGLLWLSLGDQGSGISSVGRGEVCEGWA